MCLAVKTVNLWIQYCFVDHILPTEVMGSRDMAFPKTWLNVSFLEKASMLKMQLDFYLKAIRSTCPIFWNFF